MRVKIRAMLYFHISLNTPHSFNSGFQFSISLVFFMQDISFSKKKGFNTSETRRTQNSSIP